MCKNISYLVALDMVLMDKVVETAHLKILKTSNLKKIERTSVAI